MYVVDFNANLFEFPAKPREKLPCNVLKGRDAYAKKVLNADARNADNNLTREALIFTDWRLS